MQRFALTLVQGAQGSGKSTLIDAAVASSDSRGSRGIVRLAVSRTADLRVELARLDASAIEHVVAELGGNTRSQLLAGSGRALSPRRLGRRIVAEPVRVVTVADATRFLSDLEAEATSDEESEGEPSRLAVVLERAEASDVIVVTKADLLSSDALRVVLAMFAEINPAAAIAVARHGRLLGFDLLAPEAYELERALRSEVPRDRYDPAARERAALGVSSYVYRARRPFHPARLRAHLGEAWPGVVRSRGIFWLATRMSEAGAWSQVGRIWQTSRGGFWWSALEAQGWPIPENLEDVVRAEWREPFGDRRQDLTFIGIDLDTRAVQLGFDACLLTDEELEAGPDGWSRLLDPFPDWAPRSTAPAQPRLL